VILRWRLVALENNVNEKTCVTIQYRKYCLTSQLTLRIQSQRLQNYIQPYYRVIKKSLCTWWLQYNRKAQRDFLITLYIYRHTTGWSKSLCAPDDCNTIVRRREIFWSPCTSIAILQGDQKVSVHLMIAIQSSGAERFFWSPCTSIPVHHRFMQAQERFENSNAFQLPVHNSTTLIK